MAAIDWQSAFNLAAGLVGGLGAVVLASVRDELKKLRSDHDALLRSLPETYARRDDVRDGFARIEAALARIEQSLAGKADK